METKSVVRRYDLDWLRVIAILCVFVFHTMRAFNYEPWSARNAVSYPAAQAVTDFLGTFQMPLIFVISGASLFYALRKGPLGATIGKFIKDKALRLLVPLVVGIFTYTIFTVYLDRLTNAKFSGSFLQFIPHYFDGIYLSSTGDGNFAFHGLHLWYLELLFVFSVIFLPLFLFLKSRFGSRILNWVTRIMALPGGIYLLLPLPVILSETFLDENSILGSNLLGWSFMVYILFFLAGFAIISSDRLQESIKRFRWVSLALAVALTVIWFTTHEHRDGMCWAWVLAILGLGMKYLNFKTPFLAYANDAVLPFYIMHQTFIIPIAFVVVTWNIPDLLKWAIIFVASFSVCVGLYEFVVRRSNVMRILSGMKPIKKAPQPAAEPGIPQAA